MDAKHWLDDEIQQLKTSRDELRVQLNLAARETRDRFEATEKRWHELEARLRAVGRESREAMDDVGEATRLLRDEIREAYRHIRDAL